MPMLVGRSVSGCLIEDISVVDRENPEVYAVEVLVSDYDDLREGFVVGSQRLWVVEFLNLMLLQLSMHCKPGCHGNACFGRLFLRTKISLQYLNQERATS